MSEHPVSPYDDGELYDSLFESHHDDLPFWTAFVREGRGPFLDLACATGRVLIPLLEAGFDGDGLDASAKMLARCKANAEVTGKQPFLLRGTNKAELERLFRGTGFRPWETPAGFARGPLTPAAQQMIATAWR